ncbi:MAG: hypothetical protein ACE5QF_04800, partial [Thermoplasmata archaeon]
GMTDVQFDSMDDIVGSGWGPEGSLGSIIGWDQETSNIVEGSGSMNISFDQIAPANPSRYGGAERLMGGGQDWSVYNQLILMADTNFTGSGLLLYVNLSDGVVEQNLPAQEITPGWSTYSFILQDFIGDLSSITAVRILVTNVTVPVLFYVDDIHLTFHKNFDETSWINQTFTKPAQTSGQPGGVILTFDYLAESVTNVTSFNASLRVNNSASEFLWSSEFLSPSAWTSMYFDLSSFMTDPGMYQISLSLRLIIDTSDACLAALRFDNISIVWPDHTDGWLESRVFGASSHTMWENISWTEGPQDPAYDIVVRTRTGNTSSPDGSWSPWSPPLTVPSGEPISSPSGRYIQYNVSLTTTNGSLTPTLSEIRILGWHYAPSGYVRTSDFTPTDTLLGWRWFNATYATPAGCSITFWYWNDTAQAWLQATPGENLSALSAQNITLRANLSTADTMMTPKLFNMSVDYEFLGGVDRIVVVPSIWNGTADDTFDFEAVAYDSYGHILDVIFDWSVTDPNGTISSDGLYAPWGSGNWTVTARANGVWANATVNISPGQLDRLEISPDSWSGSTDESVDFECRGYDQRGNAVEFTAEWSTTDPTGFVSSSGTYYPRSGNASGSVWTVYCNETTMSLSVSALVTVTPGSLHTLRISPWSLGTITTDENITLRCYGYDFFDNFIGPMDANWSLSGNFGTISPERTSSAIFDPIVAGTAGNITARYDNQTYATTDDFLITEGSLATLRILPAEVNLTVGKKQQFMVLGYDADGNEVAVNQSQVVWTSNVGSVTQNELKAQTISDAGWMNATLNGVNASAIVRVNPLAPPIWNLIYWPWSILILLAVLAAIIVAWRTVREMYSVEDVFVVGNEGRLIAHKTRRLHADRDEDILAGMLTAIQEFIRDSFREGDNLKKFEFGEKSILVQKGDHIYMAAIFAGKVPRRAESSLQAFISDFEKKFEFDKKKWSGDVTQLEDLDEMMDLVVGIKKYREGDWERKLK